LKKENDMYIYTQKPTDWIFGSYTGIKRDGKNNGGQWTDYLPVMESQIIDGQDTWFCTTFSTLNCLEILHKWKTGVEKNWSDMYNAVLAGTRPLGGNSLQVVGDTIRQYGLVNETDYPMQKWFEGIKVPQEITDKGKKWFDTYAFNFESVRPSLESYQNDVIDALEYSPLAVGVAYADGEGILNPKTQPNHLVALVGYKYGEYWIVMDSYKTKLKKYHWNYRFAGIVSYNLTIKNEHMLKLIDNQIYLLVEGKEQKAGIAVDGKLMIGDKTDVLFNSVARNGGFHKTSIIPVSLVDWNSVGKTDLKGNPL
jgi:hypothetical protein